MSHFTKDLLKSRINAGIKGKIGVLINADDTMNQAVRSVLSEADMRSTRRVVTLPSGVFNSIYAYPSPPDLKAQRLVSLRNQANPTDTYFGFNLIPYEQFNAKYGVFGRGESSFALNTSQREPYTVAFDQVNGVSRMLLNSPQNGSSTVLASLDSVNDGVTTWIPFGGATGLVTDTGNALFGAACIKYNIDATPVTTAGIQSLTVPTFSISNFLATSDALFLSVYLSNAADITNFKVRLGVDVVNYYELTATTTTFNTVVEEGWNVLRFEISSLVTVGTVDPDLLTHIALYMTKAVTKVSQSTFRFDHLTINSGDIFEVRYYSHFGWQSVDDVWKENSDEDDDSLVCDMDEFNLFIDKGIAMAGEEVDEMVASQNAGDRYMRNLEKYLNMNPSEALIETSDYQAQYYI